MGIGFLFITLFFLMSAPTYTSFLIGIIVAALGESIRVWAAGYIHKRSILTTAGPYAHTRNPLYFGSFLIGCGLSIVSNNVYLFSVFLWAYATIYTKTMEREEDFLLKEFGKDFEGYKYSVPLFFPQISSRGIPNEHQLRFSWKHSLSFSKNSEIEGVLGFITCTLLFYGLIVYSPAIHLKYSYLVTVILFLCIRWGYYYHRMNKKDVATQ